MSYAVPDAPAPFASRGASEYFARVVERERLLRLARLVGELGEMPAAHADETIGHLLEHTCRLIDASDALLCLGFRDARHAPSDPLRGWRSTRAIRFGPNAERDGRLLDAWYHHRPNLPLDHGIVTLSRAQHVLAVRQIELLASASGDQGPVLDLLDACGIDDRILATRPIADGVKLLFGAYRRRGAPRFAADDAQLVEALMTAIAAPARRIALANGILGTTRPLTVRERQVLRHLLEGRNEKQSALELGLAPRSLHHHVSALYGKFGVRSRAELMALFLGAPAHGSGLACGTPGLPGEQPAPDPEDAEAPR